LLFCTHNYLDSVFIIALYPRTGVRVKETTSHICHFPRPAIGLDNQEFLKQEAKLGWIL